jgi:hypothetical protein
MIRKSLFATAAVLSTALFLATPSQVEAQVTFSPKVSYASDNIDLGIGLRVATPLGALLQVEDGFLSELTGFADLDYFFPDCGTGCDFDYFEIAAGAAYPIVVDATVQPYVGAGLIYSNISFDLPGDFPGFPFGDSDSEISLNLLGGLGFDLGPLDAFSEVRIELGGAELFVVSLGATFGG